MVFFEDSHKFKFEAMYIFWLGNANTLLKIADWKCNQLNWKTNYFEDDWLYL